MVGNQKDDSRAKRLSFSRGLGLGLGVMLEADVDVVLGLRQEVGGIGVPKSLMGE